MHILVVGPGAVGRWIAGVLAVGGQHVALFDRNERRARRISESGLLLIDPEGASRSVQVAVLTAAGWIEQEPSGAPEPAPGSVAPLTPPLFELVVACVKAHDLGPALEQVRSLGRAQSCCLALSNGLGVIETVERVWGPDNALAGSCTYGMERHGDMGVHCTGAGHIRIGSHHVEHEKLAGIRQVFHNAGLACEVVSDIDRVLWTKVAVNCAINPAAALLGVRNGQLLACGLEPALGGVIDEIVRVAAAEGVQLDGDALRVEMRRVCEATARNLGSMATDLACGRRTEIDALCGAVAERGTRFGISTPVNALLAALIRARQAATSS